MKIKNYILEKENIKTRIHMSKKYEYMSDELKKQIFKVCMGYLKESKTSFTHNGDENMIKTLENMLRMNNDADIDSLNKDVKNNIIKKCESLLLKFYEYCALPSQKIINESGEHRRISPDVHWGTSHSPLVREYNIIWNVINTTKNNFEKLTKENLNELNSLYRKYTGIENVR